MANPSLERLLDFDAPFDVPLLDQVVQAFYCSTNETDRNIAQVFLTKFKEHPQAWTRVKSILELSTSDNTKFIALQILDELIKYRWKILPEDQRRGIKNYTVDLIIKMSSDNNSMNAQKLVLSRLNMTLVQVLKQDWANNWTNFIPEIIQASATNECICENNLKILMLLSEEVFDFSKNEMTTDKIRELKSKLNEEFFAIYQLCDLVLQQCKKVALLKATLDTLLRYLSWIPVNYIFKTNMIETLVTKFFALPEYRNVTLKCLTEIAGMKISESPSEKFEGLLMAFMEQLRVILPLQTDIKSVYDGAPAESQNFIQDLALFFSTLFTTHRPELEKDYLARTLLEAHEYLIKISMVDDRELFKTCMDYWCNYAKDQYNEVPLPTGPLVLDVAAVTPRRKLYAAISSKARRVVISKMAKPEEIIIVEDENGNLIRERVPDGEAVALYKLMRETLVFLTHLDYDDTQNIMLEKLGHQMDNSEWSWYNLNTLCWAIGSIANALTESRERRFLVTVIKDLLRLCEQKKGKDNKAVVASGIMYIVGQYPRFLRVHWKFLSTVVNKLFEFMHETHPGVQDMSCDTILKIVKSCAPKFAMIHPGESNTFTVYVLQNIGQIISDLSEQQIHTFYEAVGWMINAHEEREMEPLISQLMEVPNVKWREIMAQAKHNIEVLNSTATIRRIANILRTNYHACMTIGSGFVTQVAKIYLDVLNVCKYYSEQISLAITVSGPTATRSPIVKEMRSVKRETLKFITTFIGVAKDSEVIIANILPPLLPYVLEDYKVSLPDARDHEVLALIEQITSKCQGRVTAEIPKMLDAVFQCTLMMLSKNFEDYPEIRAEFFKFLRSVTTHCFEAFVRMPPDVFKLILHSIIWGIKHTVQSISENALETLIEIVNQIQKDTNILNAFCQSYYLAILSDIFFVLTDTFHKAGIKLQTRLLLQLITFVESGIVVAPLWDTATVTDPNMNNRRFLREHLLNLLSSAFKNLSEREIVDFVQALFTRTDLVQFQTTVRDFLVKMKEFSGGDDNSKLYRTEQEQEQKLKDQQALAVPGLVGPHDARRGSLTMLD